MDRLQADDYFKGGYLLQRFLDLWCRTPICRRRHDLVSYLEHIDSSLQNISLFLILTQKIHAPGSTHSAQAAQHTICRQTPIAPFPGRTLHLDEAGLMSPAPEVSPVCLALRPSSTPQPHFLKKRVKQGCEPGVGGSGVAKLHLLITTPSMMKVSLKTN